MALEGFGRTVYTRLCRTNVLLAVLAIRRRVVILCANVAYMRALQLSPRAWCRTGSATGKGASSAAGTEIGSHQNITNT